MLWVVAKDVERGMEGGEWEEEIQKVRVWAYHTGDKVIVNQCSLPATSTSISVRATGQQQQGNAFGRTTRAYKPTQQRDKGTLERTMGLMMHSKSMHGGKIDPKASQYSSRIPSITTT